MIAVIAVECGIRGNCGMRGNCGDCGDCGVTQNPLYFPLSVLNCLMQHYLAAGDWDGLACFIFLLYGVDYRAGDIFYGAAPF